MRARKKALINRARPSGMATVCSCCIYRVGGRGEKRAQNRSIVTKKAGPKKYKKKKKPQRQQRQKTYKMLCRKKRNESQRNTPSTASFIAII
jgi:hypothetical protein